MRPRKALPLALALFALVAGCDLVPTRSIFSRPNAAPSLPPVTSVPKTGSLADLQAAYVGAVKKVLPSVVQIEGRNTLGSGIVFDSAGNIATNAHVVSGERQLTVTVADGRKFPATLVGEFVSDDIAVIHIDGANVAPVTFADSSTLEVGDIAIAVGNPLGLRSSVTSGIVSAVGRTVSEGNGVTLPNVVQTSAEINPGNSGGALVDIAGDVIGIPTLVASDPQLGGAAAGIGFAIPSNTVRDIGAQLVKSGKVTNSHRAFLGVRLATSSSGGAVVADVTSGGPAARAGLQGGDVITAIDGQSVDSAVAVTEALAKHSPGDRVKLTVRSQDRGTRDITVTLGELPG